MKNSRGFTLVEVIVVAIIVAVLAAAAIGFYIHYTRDAKRSVCDNMAESLATFCAACRSAEGLISPALPQTGLAEGTVIRCSMVQGEPEKGAWIVPSGLECDISGDMNNGGDAVVRNVGIPSIFGTRTW